MCSNFGGFRCSPPPPPFQKSRGARALLANSHYSSLDLIFFQKSPQLYIVCRVRRSTPHQHLLRYPSPLFKHASNSSWTMLASGTKPGCKQSWTPMVLQHMAESSTISIIGPVNAEKLVFSFYPCLAGDSNFTFQPHAYLHLLLKHWTVS